MIHVVLSILVALLYIATGGGKVLGLGYAERQRRILRVSPTFWRVTGALEWAGAVGLVVGTLIPPVGLVAGSALVLFMIGAASARVRAARIAGKSTGLARGVAADVVVGLIVLVTVVLIALGV